MTLLYIVIGLVVLAWTGGFIGTFRNTYVPKAEPWYSKLFAYTLLFFCWPFVLLYMQSRE